MTFFMRPAAALSLILSGALFGFFYAWICSTMWGLDAADPRVAIAAMQAMNASVRNAVFAPAFFGTAPVLFVTAVIAAGGGVRSAAAGFGIGALLVLSAVILTASVNVPMNEALGALTVPDDIDAARAIWSDYSPRWQTYNTIRTVLSGAGLLAVGSALTRMPRA